MTLKEKRLDYIGRKLIQRKEVGQVTREKYYNFNARRYVNEEQKKIY